MSDSVADQGWTRVAGTGQIAEGSALAVRVADRPVCLVRARGQLHALLDRCSHGEVPLSDGDVEDGAIECFLHGSRFELTTGRPLTPPATQPVPTFAVRVVGEEIYVSTESAGRRERRGDPVTSPPSDSAPVDLQALAEELLAQATGRAQRAARTLPHPVNGLRQTVIALRAGAELHEHNSPGPAALLVLRGRAGLIAGEVAVSLGPHQYLAIPPRRHSLHADSDTVVLLSVAVNVPTPPATASPSRGEEPARH